MLAQAGLFLLDTLTGFFSVALLLRGDHDMNEVKVGKLPGLAEFRFATLTEIEEHFGCKPGYLGPIGLLKPLNIVVDRDVAVMSDWICGANEPDFHITGVNWGRDLPEPALVADLRNVVAGDALAQPIDDEVDEGP